MLKLLVLREQLRAFYGKHSTAITAGIRFLTALVSMICLNSALGYMKVLKSPAIVLVLALISSVCPFGGICWILALFMLAHIFAVSLELALITAAFLLVVALLYYGFAPGDSWMDVYIGIPFCTTRCAYCSFSSGEIGDGSLVGPYMAALIREMRACAEILKESGRQLRALYVGGGTPTALPQEAFEQLLAETLSCFPGAMEYTVEAGRPDTLTRAKLRAIRQAGISRISINPQTMNDRTLEVIGRAHTAQQVRDAYALAREEAIPHINMDVIAGLPGENEADFAHTLEEARKRHPESFTVHTLAIKRSSRMSLEKHPLPDGEMTARMVDAGRETARAMGMVPYYLYKQKQMAGNLENTGYALPGHACLYNVDIMEETSHILAMGEGGISKRIWPEEGHITRAPNVSNILEYISRTDEMISRKRELFPPLK